MSTKKKKFLHAKIPAQQMSYEKYLERGISEANTRGAKVTIHTYLKRMPAELQKAYECDSKWMRDDGSIVVVLKSGGKIIAHTMIDKGFYYSSIRKTNTTEGRLDLDYMIESVESSFLRPLRSAIDVRLEVRSK